jgi:hypothetical protein
MSLLFFIVGMDKFLFFETIDSKVEERLVDLICLTAILKLLFIKLYVFGLFLILPTNRLPFT